MVDTTRDKIQSIVFSAAELRIITNWDDRVIEEWLNLFRNFVLLSETLDDVTGAVATVTRITAGDSPYSIQPDDGTIFCNTTGGSIIVTLPPGVQSETHRVVNTGQAGNPVIIQTSLGQDINGSTDDAVLYDLESFDLQYDDNDGWF